MHLIVCGLARNLESEIRPTIERLASNFKKLGDLSVVVVESDSEDKTLDTLIQMKSEIDSLHVVSLGRLEARLPNRIDRLSRCRNAYVDYIRNNFTVEDDAWVCVVDLDGIASNIPIDEITLAISSGMADAYTANQEGPYYDIFALRCHGWVEKDPFLSQRELMLQGFSEKTAHKKAILDSMKRIPPSSPPVIVDSAFGGLAVYRMRYFVASHYSPVNETGLPQCEHVEFSRQFRKSGGRIVIWPKLVIGGYNQHSRYLHPVRRFFTPLISLIRRILVKTLGSNKTEKLSQKIVKRLGI